MALIISGRPRIPIVGAERIVVHQIKFYRLKEIRRKFAIGLNGLHPTFFCFGMFPVEIRKSKHIRNLSLFIAGGGEGAGRVRGGGKGAGGLWGVITWLSGGTEGGISRHQQSIEREL